MTRELLPRRALLLAGVLSPLLYAVADVVAGMRWKEYSFRDQTISELGAIGAPSRPLFSILLLVVYLLLLAFGLGVRQAAAGSRRLRVAGALLVALAVMALTVGQFVPMRLRGSEQGLSGTLHLVEGAVAMLMVLTVMGFAATALGRSFRFYTVATIVIMFVFGAWSGADAPRIEAGLATPWVGVTERIFWYAYQLWFMVLGLALLRRPSRVTEPR
jgi:hypothetical membrane protein